MEGKNKIFFAYPALYEQTMSKEQMYIPCLMFYRLKPNAVNTIVVTVGYSAIVTPNKLFVVNVYEVGKPLPPRLPEKKGRAELLDFFKVNDECGLVLASFIVDDFVVSGSGYYEIKVSMIDSIEDINVIDEIKTQFFVNVMEEN